MAVVGNDLSFYNKNVLRSLPNWNLLGSSTVAGDYINIKAGGFAGVDLSNDYYNGLKASKYRSITVQIYCTHTNISDLNNYQNTIEVVLKGVYKDRDSNLVETYMSVNATLLGSSYSDGVLTFSRILKMENFDMDACALYVINHSAGEFQLQGCAMYRSQDVNSSQIGESIGWGITLEKVIAYSDGCELYYDGVQQPDKLWWMQDADGNFSGINVNNTRMIKFTRKNEILLD